MTKPPKIAQPLSSFGNELLSTLREGANRELRITFDSVKMATRFHQRINQLRLAMKKSHSPGWENLYRCGMHFAENDPKTLILQPKDSEFRSFLTKAGVPDVAEPAPVMEVSVPTPLPGADADSFLSTLVDVTKVPKDEG